MATKIKLGARPEFFKPFPVKFTMPDGSDGVISATYRYRTRSEFGEMLNEAFAEAAKAGTPVAEAPKKRGKKGGEEAPAEAPAAPAPAADKVDFQALYANIASKNAEHLLKALAAWDLDEPLNLDKLKELADQLPAGAAAMMAAYAAACSEGRLGN